MRTRRSILAAVVLSLVAAGFSGGVRAEIAAETDAAGRYVRTVVLTSAAGGDLNIWSVERRWTHLAPLNPGGDMNGDLWPTIAEDPGQHRIPWVVWSRFTGSEYDLAWSRFIPGGWAGIEWVESPGGARSGDDLDPVLAFDSRGLAILVWWRNEGGIGRVYATSFQDVGWMPALLVSDRGVDSRSPQVTVLPYDQISVAFSTPTGRVVRDLTGYLPLTILDDIDPINGIGTTSSSGVVPTSGPGH
jgi:hypothetical protein